MDTKRSIPLSEYRRAGFRLLYENTSTSGVLVAATIASLLITFSLALTLSLVLIAAELFGATAEATDFASAWLTIPLREQYTLSEMLLLPFETAASLWAFDLILTALFAAAALPARRSFFLNLVHERGQGSGNPVTRNWPAWIFSAAAAVALFVLMLPYFRGLPLRPGLPIAIPPDMPLLTALGILLFAVPCGLLLQYLFEWAHFRGLLIWHRIFIFGPKRVDGQRILGLFYSEDE
jgi:hypothetical protein